MADYFTHFSLVLPLKAEQRDYALELVKHIEAYRNSDQVLPATFPPELAECLEDWSFEVEVERDGIWLHSDSGGQEMACIFIQHLLQKFQFAPGIAFEWSHDCSQPGTDAFGGGAAYVTAEEIETFTTSQWLSSKSC